jgi:hypothetical protein
MRDLDRLKCIQAVVDGDLKLVRASERLGLTTRQVRRLARRYAARGPVGLISKRFNRPSNNRQDPKVNVRGFWTDFGYREAQNQARHRCGQGDRAAITDRGRLMDSAQAAAAKDSAAAYQAGVHWGADPDRRLRASLVRKSRSCVHRVGLHRRCDESPDADLIQRN